MGYKPQKNDHVRIENYSGMLHPMTIFVIKETRPDLSLVFLPTRINGVADLNEQWVENERLIKVYAPRS